MSSKLGRCVQTTILVLTIAGAAAAQDPGSQLIGIGAGMAEMVGDFVNETGRMRATRAEASARIESARADYIQALKSNAGIEAAELEFEKALSLKDYLYLIDYIGAGDAQRAKAIALLGGEIDRGIHGAAKPEYEEWALAVASTVWRSMLQGDPIAGMERGLDEQAGRYEAYRVLRDRVERYTTRFQAGLGRDDQFLSIMLIQSARPAGYRLDAATRDFEKFEAKYGAEHTISKIMEFVEAGRLRTNDSWYELQAHVGPIDDRPAQSSTGASTSTGSTTATEGSNATSGRESTSSGRTTRRRR